MSRYEITSQSNRLSEGSIDSTSSNPLCRARSPVFALEFQRPRQRCKCHMLRQIPRSNRLLKYLGPESAHRHVETLI